MRIQLDLVPVDLGDAERLSAAEAASLAGRLHDLLVDAGFEVTAGQDRAEVDEDLPDWGLLTPAERAAGGFDYPELVIKGPAAIHVDVFLRSVFFSTEPEFDAEQAATAQVVTALRALAPLVVIPPEQWTEIEEAAARYAVAADGSILRPILTWSELSDRAVALFDEARSPERPRPEQEQYAGRLAALGDHTAGLPPFRASIAADPSGSSFALQLPYRPPFTDVDLEPLQQAMQDILDEALGAADERTGVPTGLVVDHDANATTATLVFDNLVDSGAMDPTLRAEGHRTAPFAWEAIATRAARRDPAYRPTWLVDAVSLLAAGGTDITLTADPSPAEDLEPPSPGFRGRLRRLFGGR